MAGGTGGHVFPALAVAAALVERGVSVVWMGTRAGLEGRVIPSAGYPVEWISVSGLRRKGLMSWLAAPLRLTRAVAQALGAVRRQRPQVVLGMGGFVSGPGGVAARLARRPLVIHEQNARAGLTNRVLARLANDVLEAFPDTFKAARAAAVVGNPVRAEIIALEPPERRFADRDAVPRLLVLGGSQGALALNCVVPEALARLPGGLFPDVWHQAGRTLAEAESAYRGLRLKLKLEDFIDDMAAAYAWADLVICRAGALTVAELAAAGVGAILVPYPAAVDDHQTLNGRYLTEAGAARIVQQSDLTSEALAEMLAALLGDRARLLEMARAARARAWPDATDHIVDHCLAAAVAGGGVMSTERSHD